MVSRLTLLGKQETGEGKFSSIINMSYFGKNSNFSVMTPRALCPERRLLFVINCRGLHKNSLLP